MSSHKTTRILPIPPPARARGQGRRGRRAAAGAVLLVLTACALFCFLRPGDGRDSVGPPASLTLGLALQPSGALAMIALEEGFFERAGLKPVVREYVSGKRALAAMLAGEVQVATTGEPPVVFSSFTHPDLRVLSVIGISDNEPRIVARADRGIAGIPDLRGKRVGTQQDSAVHFFLYLALLKHGLDEGEIELCFMKAEDLPDALATGDIDAFSMREPQVSRARAKLPGNTVVFAERGLYHRMELLVTDAAVASAHRESLLRCLRGLVLAEAFARLHPEQALQIVTRRLGLERGQVTELWPDLQLGLGLDQSLLLRLEDEARWALRNQTHGEPLRIPNYLDYIQPDLLRAVAPEAVHIID